MQSPAARGSYLRDREENCLHLNIQHTCRYWVDHLMRSDVILCENGQAHQFLKHFLHWLGALSIMGKIPEGVLMITALQYMLAVSDIVPIPDADLVDV
jgi:hypothetical protein